MMGWVFLLLGVLVGTYFAARAALRSPDISAAPGRMADLSQGRTHYRWNGPLNGPVVVCVHGVTSGSFVWQPLIRSLNMMGFRVLSYDLYGRGYSDAPRGRQSTDFHLRQLTDLLADQNVEGPVTLIGYSMGGTIAARFAATHPDRVERLVLLCTAGFGVKLPRLIRWCARVPVLGDWWMGVLGGAAMRRDLRGKSYAEDFPNIARAQIADTYRRGYVGAVISSARHCLSTRQDAAHRTIAAAGIPVLAIWGGRDGVIPDTAPGALAVADHHARHGTVDEADHALPFTHVADFIPTLQVFLRET